MQDIRHLNTREEDFVTKTIWTGRGNFEKDFCLKTKLTSKPFTCFLVLTGRAALPAYNVFPKQRRRLRWCSGRVASGPPARRRGPRDPSQSESPISRCLLSGVSWTASGTQGRESPDTFVELHEQRHKIFVREKWRSRLSTSPGDLRIKNLEQTSVYTNLKDVPLLPV